MRVRRPHKNIDIERQRMITDNIMIKKKLIY